MANFCSGFDPPSRGFGGRGQDQGGWYSNSGPAYGGESCGGPQGGSSSRTPIRDLTPHLPNTVIVGIVATKQNIHSFPDKRNPGSERFKLSFTLRDSPSDYINVTCWGSEDHIRRLSDSFKICDVVELQNSQITSKTGGEYEDRWKPWTPSQYQINVSEGHSVLDPYTGWDYTEFTALAHVPLRPPNDYYPLGDITASGHSLDGSYINILAIVKSLGVPRQMTSRSGKALKKCEVKVMDDSCRSFTLFMWDDELIDLAQTWSPRENIIFAVDVKVSFDSYRNSMVGTCDQKTIITTNPDCHEAHRLYQFAQTVEVSHSQEEEGGSTATQDDVRSISQVYTVEQVKAQQQTAKSSFSGIVFVLLTSLEIDQDPHSTVCYRCTSCKWRVEPGVAQCPNSSCPAPSSGQEPSYNILLSLSDHTDSLEGARLTGQPATDLLQHTPQEFLLISSEERTELKSSLLLERFKVYFKSVVLEQRKPSVRILSMSLADPEEAANCLAG